MPTNGKSTCNIHGCRRQKLRPSVSFCEMHEHQFKRFQSLAFDEFGSSRGVTDAYKSLVALNQ